MTIESKLDKLKYAIQLEPSLFFNHQCTLKQAYDAAKSIDTVNVLIQKTLLAMIDKQLRKQDLFTVKKEVLIKLREFVVAPTNDSWGDVCEAMYSNIGYAKGMTSKTRDLVFKVKYLYGSYTQNQKIPERQIFRKETTHHSRFLRTDKSDDAVINELYDFINASKRWADLSDAAKNYTKNEKIRGLVEARIVRKQMPDVDQLCIDIGLYLKKHPHHGAKYNVMLALFNFIDNANFSLKDLMRALIENPDYAQSYRQQSRVLEFTKQVMAHAKHISAEKHLPSSLDRKTLKSNCIEKLKVLQEKYRLNQNQSKKIVCNALIQLITEDSNPAAWDNLYEQQMNCPDWNQASGRSELATCYEQIKQIYVEYSDYFNFCEILLDIVQRCERSFQDPWMLTCVKLTARAIQTRLFINPDVSEKLMQDVLANLNKNPQMTAEKLITIKNIFFDDGQGDDEKNSRNGSRISLTLSDGSFSRHGLSAASITQQLNFLGQLR